MLLRPIEIVSDEARAELRIDAPVPKLFDYVSDLRNMVTWWPEHPVYRRARGDGATGTLYFWKYVVRGFPLVGYSRVLARDRPARGARRGSICRVARPSCGSSFAVQVVPEVTRALDRLAAQLA